MKMKTWIGGFLAALLAFGPAAQALAQEPLQKLTVTQAAAQVAANSEELKKNSENKTLSDLERQNIVDQMETGADDTTKLSLTVQLMQNDIQRSAYSDTEEVFKEKAVYSVEQLFASVIAAENDLALTKTNADISQREYTIGKVKYSLGRISELELKTAKASWEKLENSLSAKQTAIDKAYMSLNEMMGASLSNRYSLQFAPAYAPMIVADVDSAVGVAMAQSSNVQSLADSMKLADYELSVYGWDPDSTDIEQEKYEIASDQAHRSYATGRTDLESQVLNAYRSALDLESDMASAELSLLSLREQLTVKESELELGKATELDVLKLRLQEAQQKESIRKLTCDHYLKVKQLKNANLL